MTADASADTQEKPAGSCGSCKTDFNYCFWAKFLVAIPALPLIAFWAGSFFHHEWSKDIAGGVAVFLTVYLAIKFDNLPIFSGKVVKKKPCSN